MAICASREAMVDIVLHVPSQIGASQIMASEVTPVQLAQPGGTYSKVYPSFKGRGSQRH